MMPCRVYGSGPNLSRCVNVQDKCEETIHYGDKAGRDDSAHDPRPELPVICGVIPSEQNKEGEGGSGVKPEEICAPKNIDHGQSETRRDIDNLLAVETAVLGGTVSEGFEKRPEGQHNKDC
jgi:hypothetical protein